MTGSLLDGAAVAGQTRRMLIYKILTAAEWAALEATGRFDGAAILEPPQETAEKHFAGQSGLMLAALEADTYGDDLRWEVSRGGAEFPHIYNRPLLRSEVVWASPIPVVDGVPQVPVP